MKTALLLIALCATAVAQVSLSGTGATVRPGQTMAVTLSLSSPVAGLQFEIVPPAGVTSILPTAGQALGAAGKTLSCAPLATGATRCVIVGLNANTFSGPLLTIGAVVAPNAPLGPMSMIASALVGVDAGGSLVPLTATAANWTVTVAYDLTSDGLVDAKDLSAVVDQILGEMQCQTADFDLSGSCTLEDAAILISAALAPQPPGNPMITSVTPSVGAGGQTVNVTIAGTGFVSGALIRVEGTVVTVSNVAVVSQTSITATFAIRAGATPRPRNVTVTTPAGTSNPMPFTVQ